MGSGRSGLYSGTHGSSEITKASDINGNIAEDASSRASKTHDFSTDLYHASKTLQSHIENAETASSGSSGIKGAHNKNNFLREVNRIGAKAIASTPNSQIDGVEQIRYKMPKKDKYGKPTGDLKAQSFKKTVYDPSKIGTDKYIERGLQAANNSARKSESGKLGREWSGIDNQNVKWHGYCDQNGNIISFYPED
jgi:hypothetical protein